MHRTARIDLLTTNLYLLLILRCRLSSPRCCFCLFVSNKRQLISVSARQIQKHSSLGLNCSVHACGSMWWANFCELLLMTAHSPSFSGCFLVALWSFYNDWSFHVIVITGISLTFAELYTTAIYGKCSEQKRLLEKDTYDRLVAK